MCSKSLNEVFTVIISTCLPVSLPQVDWLVNVKSDMTGPALESGQTLLMIQLCTWTEADGLEIRKISDLNNKTWDLWW